MRRLLIGFSLLVLSGCSSPDAEIVEKSRTEPSSAPGKATVLVYRCDHSRHFVVEIRPGSAFVFFPGINRKLPALGGSQYGDGQVKLDLTGSVSLTTAVETLTNCINDRRSAIWEEAKLRGVDFRAVGNEPGWVMELSGNHANLRLDYGTRVIDVELSSPVVDDSERKTRFKSPEIEVMIEGSRCSDVMSGESFEAVVEVKVGKRLYKGCGRALH